MFQIPAPNYTQAPNALFDEWLPKLKLVELRVLMVIMRKTFGWHKVRDRISLSQLEKCTGSQRGDILKATKKLEAFGLITKEVLGTNGDKETYYELVIHENSNNSYQCESHTPTSVNLTPTKERTKEIEKEVLHTSKKKTGLSANASILAEEFYKIMKSSHGEDFRQPNMDAWAKHFDKMLRIDQRDISVIRSVMKWVIKDPFWRTNILSPGNLREKFLSLKLKMETPVATHNKKTLKSQEAQWTRTEDTHAETDILTPLLASLK